MAAHVTNSRKGLRRLERTTGEKLVWATGEWVTTVDHRHLRWSSLNCRWYEMLEQDAAATVPGYSPCGLPVALSSCRWLFGEPEFGFTRGLMRGPCSQCGVGCSQLHRWDCDRLSSLMEYVNPDYWPRPVHQPMWIDDSWRMVALRTRAVAKLALALDVYDVASLGEPEPIRLNCADMYEQLSAAQRRLADHMGRKVLEEHGLDPERYQIEWT